MNTPAPSAELLEKASKIRAAIFAGLARVGQVEVARRLGIAESTVSKAKGDEIETVAKICAAAELKVVPASFECVDPEEMRALLTLAGGRLDRLRKKPDELYQHNAEGGTLQW